MRFIALALVGIIAACSSNDVDNEANSEAPDSSYEPVPAMQHPGDNPSSKEKVELGKLLYFDPRLSGDNATSCSTCHHPEKGWSDNLPRAIGFGGQELGRHSPTVINSGYFEVQMWDGRAPSLDKQALGPIQAAVEMNQNLDELVQELSAVPEYVERFQKVFGGITPENIGQPLYSLAVAHANDYVETNDFVAASAGLLFAYGVGASIGPTVAAMGMGWLGPSGLFTYIAVVLLGLGGFVAYRMRIRAPIPTAEQGEFIVVPRMTPAAAALDPRAPVEEPPDAEAAAEGEQPERAPGPAEQAK